MGGLDRDGDLDMGGDGAASELPLTLMGKRPVARLVVMRGVSAPSLDSSSPPPSVSEMASAGWEAIWRETPWRWARNFLI